jgi:hypothetical protein
LISTDDLNRNLLSIADDIEELKEDATQRKLMGFILPEFHADDLLLKLALQPSPALGRSEISPQDELDEFKVSKTTLFELIQVTIDSDESSFPAIDN